jgi:holo-[acyl-carrier protein] synthase
VPFRVGIDLVAVDTVREAIATHGNRYLDRVYTPREVADCRTTAGLDPQRLAARFAAKEAAFKALRVGDQAVAWSEVEIERDPAGWVKLSLNGKAAQLARRAGVDGLAVSITHERGCAAAIVIAEIRKVADT